MVVPGGYNVSEENTHADSKTEVEGSNSTQNPPTRLHGVIIHGSTSK